MLVELHTAYAIAKIMVTEDDMDPSDTREVVWAFAAKHSPSDGVRLYEDRPMVPLPVFLPANGSRALQDDQGDLQLPDAGGLRATGAAGPLDLHDGLVAGHPGAGAGALEPSTATGLTQKGWFFPPIPPVPLCPVRTRP